MKSDMNIVLFSKVSHKVISPARMPVCIMPVDVVQNWPLGLANNFNT